MKDNVKRMRRQATNREKRAANGSYRKVKDCYQNTQRTLKSQQENNLILKWVKDVTRYSTKDTARK